MLFYGITYVYWANIANLFHVGNILFVRKHINFVLYEFRREIPLQKHS